MSKPLVLFIWSLLATATMGCQSCSSERQQKHTDAGSTAASSAPTALCRAPLEPGCNPCCEPQTDGSCTIRSWNPGSADITGVEPWYNAASFQDGACPSQCRPCARCTQRAEKELQQLPSRPECDCSQPQGMDACAMPGSCPCHCQRLSRLTEACPDVAPRR